MAQNLITIPRRSYQSGPIGAGPFTKPALLNGFKIIIERCTELTPSVWANPDTVLTIWWDCSYDNGNTWQEQGTAQNHGGILVNREGIEVPNWEIKFEFDPPPTTVKLRVFIENGPLVTGVIIDAMESSRLKKQ
jgi:hypothetical protein